MFPDINLWRLQICHMWAHEVHHVCTIVYLELRKVLFKLINIILRCVILLNINVIWHTFSLNNVSIYSYHLSFKFGIFVLHVYFVIQFSITVFEFENLLLNAEEHTKAKVYEDFWDLWTFYCAINDGQRGRLRSSLSFVIVFSWLSSIAQLKLQRILFRNRTLHVNFHSCKSRSSMDILRTQIRAITNARRIFGSMTLCAYFVMKLINLT